MIIFIFRRLGFMVLTMVVVSVVLFLLLEFSPGSVATKVLGPYSSDEQRNLWLEAHGYFEPIHLRYLSWLGNFASGDFGESIRFQTPVADVLWPRLGNTGLLGLVTSVPEFASAVLLAAIFVFWLGILPGTSTMSDGFDLAQLALPVMVLVLYDFGYVTRMTRASMAEVMTQPYIRTAVLKGLPYSKVIIRHALRNALIAPFTVIMLQINWLLSGVIVVEFFFAYKGFGALLLEASLNDDIFLIEACAMVAVFVAVATQTIADVGYTFLNPRIRVR